MTPSDLAQEITARYALWTEKVELARDEVTVTVKPEHLREFAQVLRDKPEFDFRMLIDICGVDYLHYGYDEWQTTSTTETGFSRGVTEKLLAEDVQPGMQRFAVVYHLLSLTRNHRLRLRVFTSAERPLVDSVMDIWPAANWYEREAFDLFGILFQGHPDLRRLLTDYGFVGHPFRKDFPLIGKVEARYDAKLRRVVYDPVSIDPRTLEPKVIRHDNRYSAEREGGAHGQSQ